MVIIEKISDDSVAIDERQTALDEMSRVCQKTDGYGIVIDVYSRDHGTIGNARQPAHAHVLDTNLRPKGEFVITEDAPKRPSEVIWYRTKNPPDGYADKIVKWANASEEGLNNWRFIVRTWKSHHPR